MKSKKLSKSLLLNKETISNLDLKVMSNLKGGASEGFTWCGDFCTNTQDCTVPSCWPGCWTSNNPRATCGTDEPWCV